MDETQTAKTMSLKAGLAAWANKHDVRPVDFAQKMGYTNAYGWSLLRGEAAVTVACLGQFILVYGVRAADELLKFSNWPSATEQAGSDVVEPMYVEIPASA